MKWLFYYVEIYRFFAQGRSKAAWVREEPERAILLYQAKLVVKRPVHIDIYISILVMEVYDVEDGGVGGISGKEEGKHTNVSRVIAIRSAGGKGLFADDVHLKVVSFIV